MAPRDGAFWINTDRNNTDTAGTAQMGTTGLECEGPSTLGKGFNCGYLKQECPSSGRKCRAKPRRGWDCSRLSCEDPLDPHSEGTQPPPATSEERSELAGSLTRWAPPHLEKQHSQGHLQPFCSEITALGAPHRPQKLAGSTGASAQSRSCCSRLHPHLPHSSGGNISSPPWD